MAEGMFSHLINIQFHILGAQQAKQAIAEVRSATQLPWDTKQAAGYEDAIRKAFGAVKTGTAVVPEAARKMGDFERAMRRALIVAPVWMVLRGAMQAVMRTIQDQIKFLIDLETAMTRIKIVGKGTEAEYKNLQEALIGLAYGYGTTASEAANAAVIFAQQGRTVKETIELTRAAMLASKILGTDIKTAVDDMTAAIEGFKLGIGDATNIVDKWINVEKQFAVTSKDLADATKVAGASANQLGMTMSQFLGDVTAIVEVTRKSGAEAARGLSFIYTRLLTSGKQTIEQITKIPFYLDATGKATNTVGTELRSVSSILEDLAGKWESLTTQEKLEIATSLGSKRQMVALYALMQNYNASLDARIAALTSAGASEKAFALIQNTTATKMKQVSAAWNVLTAAIGDTSAFKSSLSIMDRMIINFTSLISYEKAYSALYTRDIQKTQLSNETRLNEVKSLEELINVRNKLAKLPQTPENTERLKKVQDAIDVITKKEARIKVALDTGDTETFKKSIDTVIKELQIEKIRLNVSLEFEAKLADVEGQIRNLQQEIKFTGGEDRLEKIKKLTELEEKAKKLGLDQTKSIEEQYKLLIGQEASEKAKLEGLEEEEAVSAELTEKELERLNIEKQLLIFDQKGLHSLEAQVQKEIELVKQSNTLYDIHEKNLKLEELNNKLIDARLKKREEERNKMLSLAQQYEKGDAGERERITRVTELARMSPEVLARQYADNLYDKDIITDYWSTFSQEGQRAVEDIIMKISNLPSLKNDYELQMEALDRLSQAGAATTNPISNVTTYGAKEININVDTGGMPTPEEMVKLMTNEMGKALLSNEEFVKSLSRKTIKVMPEE